MSDATSCSFHKTECTAAIVFHDRITHCIRHAIFFIGFLVWCCSVAFSQNAPYIDSIQIVRQNVFDGEVTWIEKAINSVHTVTKEYAIRRELLFHEGEPVNDQLFEETERNLRRIGFLGDITISKSPVNDTLVNVRVTTHDRWTLNANTSLKREGGITNFGVSLSENNFIGFAQSLSVDYNYRSDRINPHGMEFHFREPRLFNSYWSTTLQYFNSDDARLTTVLFEHPLYTEATSWSLGLYAENGEERKRLYSGGILVVDRLLGTEGQALWGIYSLNNTAKIRMGAAFVRNRKEYDSLVVNTSDNISLCNISLGWLTRTYSTLTFVDRLGRVEDAPFGYSLSLVTGKDLAVDDLYYFKALCQYSDYYKNVLWYWSSSVQGYNRKNLFEETFFSFSNTASWKCSVADVVTTRIIGTFAIHPRPGTQTSLDSRGNVRGIQANLLQGSSLFVCNLEYRSATFISWWIFDMGYVLFFDGGSVWKEQQLIAGQKFYKSIGIGARILNNKQQGSGIVRFDFAYNTDLKNFELILSTNQLFNAIGQLDTASPNSF